MAIVTVVGRKPSVRCHYPRSRTLLRGPARRLRSGLPRLGRTTRLAARDPLIPQPAVDYDRGRLGQAGLADNTCEICQAGYQSRCVHQVTMGSIGTQSELARIPLADGTLITVPGEPTEAQQRSLLAASDVLGTGWFAAVAAEAGPGKTVAVVGDGAVGLWGVLAAQRLGGSG